MNMYTKCSYNFRKYKEAKSWTQKWLRQLGFCDM